MSATTTAEKPEDHRLLVEVFNVRLGRVRWGNFELLFSGRNSRGRAATFCVCMPWLLWPLAAQAAAEAWAKERMQRLAEMSRIQQTLPDARHPNSAAALKEAA